MMECVAGLVDFDGERLVVATPHGDFFMDPPCTLLPEDSAEWSADAAFRVCYHPEHQFVTFLAVVRY